MSEATGRCFHCGGPVPQTNLNKFYCKDECRVAGWIAHHPGEQVPDFDGEARAIGAVKDANGNWVLRI